MGMPASEEQADVVLLFGGDGTVHRHLGQLVRVGVPVLVVPAGSGNDFARALGLRRVRDSLAAWRKFLCDACNVRRIDLGLIRSMDRGNTSSSRRAGENSSTGHAGSVPDAPVTRYFCCVAGVGLDGEVARRANRLPRWLRGHGGYVLSLAPALLTFVPLKMKILTEDEGESGRNDPKNWTIRSDQPCLLAAFANTPHYGGGMKIAPLAKIDDGLLDICIVGAVARPRLLRLAPKVYGGRHLTVPEVKYFQNRLVRVETEGRHEVYADGEYVCRTPVEVGVQRAALKIVTAE